MSDSNLTPAASALAVPRPKRIPVASSKLLDSSNTAAPSLSSHKQAIEAHRQAEHSEQSTDHRNQDESLAPLSKAPDQISMPQDPRPSSPGTDTNSDSELVEVPKSKSYLLYTILA